MTARVPPGLAAVALIALLATAAGLALASAVLTLPVAFDRRDALAVGMVVLVQALAWWWSRRRPRGLVRVAFRLAAEHKRLALWLAADLGLLAWLWGRGAAHWSRIDPVWEAVAAYVSVRAALAALIALGALLRVGEEEAVAGRGAAARGLRLALLGGALAAPAWTRLAESLPAWQGAVIGGMVALLALAACARRGAARDTWVGLAGVVAGPAMALGGCALLLANPGLPLAAPIALSALLPALGLATLATPTVLGMPPALETPRTSTTTVAP